MGKVFPVLLLAATALAAGSFHPDSFEMVEVAVLAGFADARVVCGDADHDGRQELYVQADLGDDWMGYVYEHIGGNRFDTTFFGTSRPAFSDIGDSDRDGLTDLMFEAGGSTYVYESPAMDSLPSVRVWAAPRRNASRMDAQFADLDGDSLTEMVWNVREPVDGVLFLENRGDNRYDEVFLLDPDFWWYVVSMTVCQDLDGDGKVELVAGSANARVVFIEAAADDSFEVVAVDTVRPSGILFAAAAAGPDIDRNGRPEAIVWGCDLDDTAWTIVYEATADNRFERVWTDVRPAPYTVSQKAVSVGDIDGDSLLEFVFNHGRGARMYRASGPGQYEVVWESDAYRGIVRLYDINSDGRDELICQDFGNRVTRILAYRSLGTAELNQRELERVHAVPSIVRAGAAAWLQPLESGVDVQVLSADGKVMVEDRSRIADVRRLRPGAYFVRLVSGSASVTRKVLVVD